MEAKIRARREKVLRSLYSQSTGLIVHSGAVVDDDTVYVFPGVADSGKSTLTRKLNNIFTAINDDMNLLEFKTSGIEVSTYFTQIENRGYHYLINEDAKGALKAVLFPKMEFEKDSFVEKLKDRGDIWKMLLSSVAPPLKGEDELFPNYLIMLEKLMDSTLFFNIYHNLKDSPEFIADLLRGIDDTSEIY